MKKVALLIPEGANIAPLENARHGFLAANDYQQQRGGDPCFDVCLVAATPRVRLDGGRVMVLADAVLETVGPVDICVVPPPLAQDDQMVQDNRPLVEWLVRHHMAGGEVASLCMGAALLAAGGLLDGRRAVVHWAAQQAYAQRFPDVQWASDGIVHAENGIYTSGGAFSAAHLVLHLIEKYAGRETAIWCAKYFQLDWSRRSQQPFAVFTGYKAHTDDAVRAVQEYIEAHFAEKLTIETLATRFTLGRRTLERRFRQATGNSIVEYLQRIRVEVAKTQLETSRKTVAEVMYDVGYNDTKAFRDTFVRYSGMSPVTYREQYL